MKPFHEYTTEELDALLAAHASMPEDLRPVYTTAQSADLLGVTEYTIRHRTHMGNLTAAAPRRYTLPALVESYRNPPKRGMGSPRAQASKQTRLILERLAAGASQSAVAREFGITRQRVHAIAEKHGGSQ